MDAVDAVDAGDAGDAGDAADPADPADPVDPVDDVDAGDYVDAVGGWLRVVQGFSVDFAGCWDEDHRGCAWWRNKAGFVDSRSLVAADVVSEA